MDKILQLKHWQLFLLFIIVPVLAPMFALFAERNSENGIIVGILISLVSTMLSCGIFLIWFYKTGTVLSRYVPAGISLPLARFKGLILFAIIYMAVISVGMFSTAMFVMNGEAPPRPSMLLALLVPLHLFAMFCMFYGLYFNAKVLKTVEMKREVTFSDFSGEFFLFWFFPIGVWFIQPRINAIVAQPPADPYSNMDIFTQDTH